MSIDLQNKAYYIAQHLLIDADRQQNTRVSVKMLHDQMVNHMDEADWYANRFTADHNEATVGLFVKKILDRNNIHYEREALRNAYQHYGQIFDYNQQHHVDILMASDPRSWVNDLLIKKLHVSEARYDNQYFDEQWAKRDEIPMQQITVLDDPNKIANPDHFPQMQRRQHQLYITPYATGVAREAQIQTAQAQAKDPHASAITPQQIMAMRQQYLSQMPINRQQQALNAEFDDQERGFAQLKEALGDYLSQRDLNVLQRTLQNDNYHFDNQRLQQSQKLLQHLRDTGVEYQLHTKPYHDHSWQIDILNAPGDAHNVRSLLIDEHTQAGSSQVGEVYLGNGTYYNSIPRHESYMSQNPGEILDLVMGRSNWKAVYSNLDMRNVRFLGDDNRHPIMYHSLDQHAALSADDSVPLSAETANRQLDQYINQARQIYYRKLALPASESLHGLNDALAYEQDKFTNWLADQGIVDEQADDLKMLALNQLYDDQILNDLKHPLAIDEKQATTEKADDAVQATRDAEQAGLTNLPDQTQFTPEQIQAATQYMQTLADDFVGDPDQAQFAFGHTEDLIDGESSRYHKDALVRAMKNSDKYSSESLLDQDYARDRAQELLVKFDPETAKNKRELDSEAGRALLEHVEHVLHDQYGVQGDQADASIPPQVKIDDHGILQWSGYRKMGSRNPKLSAVNGELGQIFFPDDHNIIHTKFAVDNQEANFEMVPGIEGYFQHAGLDEGKPRMERFRGRGYQQIMYEQVDGSLRQQLLAHQVGGDLSRPTDTTMMNKMYHGEIYGKRLPHDWYEQSALEPRMKNAILKTLSGRVRLGNEYSHSANSFLVTGGHGLAPGEGDSVAKLVDNQNMRVLSNDYAGYFDMVMTGTNKTQGLVLYLADGAHLNQNGSVTPASLTTVDDQGKEHRRISSAPLRELDEFKYSRNNPWDRNQMAANQVLVAKDIAQDTHLMLATCGGWTFEDSCIVSKKWAEAHPVTGKDGQTRPLGIGDKISDFSGNKSTIGMVVDPEMDPDQAYAQNLTNEVDLFKQNPKLDVVMSPYSVISRQNSGIVKELVDSKDKHDVTLVDQQGKVHQVGKMGTANMIITDMLADEKTHAYGPDALADGKGRKASSQLVWSMTELGLTDTMHDLFKGNDAAWSALREKLVATGLDMDANGELQVGYHPHANEQRQDITPDGTQMQNMSDAEKLGDDFARKLADQGALLHLPFEIKTGIDKQVIQDVPIMSASLRRSRQLMDGSTKVNDYTTNYCNMYKNALKYQFEQEHDNNPEKLARYQNNAQNAYDTIRNDIIMNDLGGYNGETAKHSFVKERLMGKRQAESATAIQTADPRLPLDTIRISPEIRKTLHLKKDDLLIIERDPALRGDAMVAMKWREDDQIKGIAVNPIVAKMYDGDFDGDTLGCLIAHSKDAQAELREKAMLKSRLRDPGTGKLILNTSMDLVSAGLKSGMLKEAQSETDDMPDQQLNQRVEEIIKTSEDEDDCLTNLSDFVVRQTLHNVNNFGSAAIDITSEETAKKSVLAITQTGAKGSPAKAQEFAEYIDNKKGLKAQQKVQLASGIKSDATGLAGATSQMLMLALRNVDPKTALEVTYPNTQGTLQIKHEESHAVTVLQGLTNKLPNLMNGIDKDTPPQMRNKALKDPRARLTRSEWTRQMIEFYDKDMDIRGIDDQIIKLGKLMADGNDVIRPIREVAQSNACVMDRWAYGAKHKGFAALVEGAKQHEKLTEGKNIQAILPASLREKDPKRDIMLKKDVQRQTVAMQTATLTAPTTSAKKTSTVTKEESEMEM